MKRNGADRRGDGQDDYEVSLALIELVNRNDQDGPGLARQVVPALEPRGGASGGLGDQDLLGDRWSLRLYDEKGLVGGTEAAAAAVITEQDRDTAEGNSP